jgi:hypothetical protein
MKKISFAFILVMAAFCHALPPFVFLKPFGVLNMTGTGNMAKNECVLYKEVLSSGRPLSARKDMVFRCVNFPTHADTVQIVVDKDLTHIEVDTLYADGSRNTMACRGEPLYNRVECRYYRIDEVGIKVRDKAVPQTGKIQYIYNSVREDYKLRK